MSWGALTQVTKGQSASVDFIVRAFPDPNSTISATHFGGVCSLTIKQEILTSPVNVTPPEWWGAGMGYGGYILYAELALSDMPPQTERIDLFESGSFWGEGHFPPETYTVEIVPLPYTASAAWTVDGIGLRAKHTETPSRSEGGVVHPTECDLEERWFTVAGVTTVTATIGSLSWEFEYDLGLGEDAEVACHTGPWRLQYSCILAGNWSQSGTLLEFGEIRLGGVEVDASQCDQDSNATYASGRGWQTNDGADYSATGSGDHIAIISNSATDLGANQWTGWSDQPFAVNFLGVNFRKFLGAYDSYNNAVVDLAGVTDPDGVAWSGTVSDLHALGTVVSPDVHSWIAQNAGEVPPYVAWTGWKPAAVQTIAINQAWALAQVEMQRGETLNDLWVILDGWPLDLTARTLEPYWRSVFVMDHVASLNVVDPPVTAERPTAFRPADWAGSGGLTVDEADNDLWTVALGASDPEATLDLVDIRIDRLTAIKAAAASGYAASGLPEGYLYTAANRDENYPEPADGKTRENPTYWACYRFARFALNVPVACTLEVRIDYDEITISDSHVTGSQRLEDLEWTFLPRIVSYSLPFATTGSQTVDVDLLAGAEELEGAKFHRVRKVTISGFPTDAEREFKFESLTLIEHPDHSFCYCKRVDPWTYTEVGFSAVIDGAVNALALPDNFHQNVEDGLGVINWLIGAETGQDLSVAFTLDAISHILDNTEGLTCEFDDTDWDAHTLDGDSNRLCDSRPWHPKEAEARDKAAATDNWDWHIAMRVGRFTIVRGLKYDFHADKILQEGLHGDTFTDGVLTDGVTVYVWKRAVGETIWTSAGSCTSNDLGYYSIGSLRVLASQGATYEDDVLYQYGVSLTNDADAVTLVGSGHQREWIARRVLGLPLWYPNLDIDAGGVIWVAAANGAGRVYVGYMDPKDTEPHWVTLPWGGAAGYAWPAIACCDDGSLLVAATIDGGMVIQRSRDRGAAWSAVMADLGSTYEYGDICQRNGVTYCCGWESDHVRFAASSETDLSEEALAVGVTELDVCDAAVAEGAEKPRSSIVVADDRGVVVAVSQDGDLRFYRCRSYSAGFSEVVSA